MSGMATRLRVAIAGAGVGGLCLAHGLQRAGIEANVYERDAALDARRQGYRLHIDARAGTALCACLPPDLLELVLATAGLPSTQFSLLSSKLKTLHVTASDPAVDRTAVDTLSVPVNRQTLREILAARLDGRLQFGRAVTGFRQDETGVDVHFASRPPERADLLVAADGVASAVRRQYLPSASVEDAGSRSIYGRTPLGAAIEPLIPDPLQLGLAAVIGGHIGMATGLIRFRNKPPDAAAAIAPDVELSPAADYLMWAVTAQQNRFPVGDADLAGLDPAGLHEIASSLIRSWHRDLRELVARADISETFLVRVGSSRPVEPWQPTRVTVLGDAIHAMSPARGSGANTALQDAALLTRLLGDCDSTSASLTAAVGAYENRMREYGYAAVQASRRAERQNAERAASLVPRLLGRLRAS